MAYTDTNQGLKPTSLAITTLVNGGVIAGLLMLGTTALRIDTDPIKIFTPTTIPPVVTPEPQTPKHEVKDEPKPTTIFRSKTVKPLDQPPVVELSTSTIGDDFPIPGTGEFIKIEPPALPPIVTPSVPPVFVTAKRNPRYAGDFQPEYPPGMVREGREGAVTVRVLVGVDGRVKQVEAVRGDDDAFLQVTKAQALRRWRFLPATKDGVPQESWQELTVRFQLPA